MKIVLWIGNEANQKALANKIHAIFPIDGIVTESRPYKPQITVQKIFEKIFEKLMLPSIGKAWWGMKKYYDEQYPQYPPTKIIDVGNINSQDAFEFTKTIDPDLIIVSGTRLIKGKMLSINPKIGILNLHTGLSPYIKGGPNCTNWCIATNQFHLIGNTIMWLDAGIDSGNIIASEFTSFEGNEDLLGTHIKVMDHAHSLYLQSISFILNGGKSSVQQSSIYEDGITYYTKQWGLKEKINLVRNIKKLKLWVQSEKIKNKRKEIKIIQIDR